MLAETSGRKTVVVRNGESSAVARVAAVARCVQPRRGADVDVTVADDAIQSNGRSIKWTACSRTAD